MIALLALVVLFDGDLSRASVSGGTFSVSGEWDLSRCGAITVELNELEPPCEGWNFDILLDGEDGSYRIGAQVTEDKPPQSVFERPLPPFWPEFHEVMKRMPGSEDLPLGLYALAWPSVYWGGQGAGWGNRIHVCDLDPRHVTKVSIVRGTYGKVPTPETPPKVKRITAGGAPYAGPVPDFVRQAPDRFFPFMDRFGQMKARTWPGKVSSDQDLQRAIAAEDADLAAHPGPKDRDKWGGWTAGPRFEATGHFYVKKVDGKWWFVDPDGYLWWSHGPVRVSPSCGMTPIKGREHFFEFLPQEGDPFAAFYRTRDALLWPYYEKRGVTNTYDFTASNLYRKYGDDWFAKWADRAHRRLRSWGANTIANSSDLRLARMSRTPYCDRFELKSRPIKGTENLGAWWPFRDPFDPSFSANLREQLLAHKDELDDPWCFGFFIDNELRWGEEGELAKWVWDSPDDQPAKVEFRRRLVAKYGKVPEPIPHEDLKAFSEAVIRGYFSSVREEFKKVAPKKMYMGCRFSGAREFVARIAAEYADVMSFNYYRKDVSGFSALPADVDRPIIIGEFHFGALDRGPIRPGLIQYASQAERAAGYVRYLESALRDPRFVGAHWHQWCDDVSTGRFDGENFQIGWVDVCDNPYPETIAAVRDIGERMYMVRSGAGAVVAALSAADVRNGEVKISGECVSYVRTAEGRGESRFSLAWAFADWETNAYVFLPAVAYNGNRDMEGRAPGAWPLVAGADGYGLEPKLEMSGVPALAADGSGVIEVTAGDLSVPCAGVFLPKAKRGFLVFTEQTFGGLNLGFTVRAGEIRVDYPARRSEAYRTANRRVADPDPKLVVDAGFAAESRFRAIDFAADDVSAFLDRFLHERRAVMSAPRAQADFDETWSVAQRFWDEDAWNGTCYTPERAWKWSSGWVGGFSTVYALARLGDARMRERCVSTVDYAVGRQLPGGFFVDVIRGTNDPGRAVWLKTDHPVHFVRNSADALYFLAKVCRVLPPKPAWTDAVRRGADAFVRLWARYGQFGKWVDPGTGEIVVGRSDAGTIVPAALLEAHRLVGDRRYLDVAKASLEDFCRRDLDRGVTYGGASDILMAPDSESAASLLESCVLMAEVTKEPKWIAEARKAAALLSTWVMPYAYEFPAKSEFRRIGINATGSVFASVQNKHSAPGLCTLSSAALVKLSELTGDPVYRELGLDIAAFIPQVMGREDRPIRCWEGKTLPPGHICERVNTSDWEGFERIGEIFCGRCWCVTALALSLADVPEAFVRWSVPRSLEDARIVRAVRETPVQRIAADELAHHLELISGRKQEEASAPGTGLSFVFGKPADAPESGPFEARYRVDWNRVWFWGDESKGFPGQYPGSQFAVYCFLERYFGVKWVAPGDKGIVFRRMKHMTLPEKSDFSYKPPLAMEILRNSTVRYLTVPALPLGCFLKDDPVPEKLRLSDAEAAAATVAAADWKYRHLLFSPDMPLYGHAFTKWQPRFRETHPEYLALDEKGNRVQSPTYDAWIKLCISNEAVVDQIIADWQAAGCPHYINVCENDGAGFCRCANCLRLDADRPGEDFLATKTDRYLNFYNRVTKKAIAIRPDVQVCAYLYAFYRHPPRREKIEYPDNMVFGMVPSLADDIDAFFTSWQAVGLKQFFFRPNFHTSLGNLPRGVEKEIYDIFKKALSYGLIGVDFDAYLWRDVLAPESYVTARMIGHPDRSFDELMDEFCGAYGEAKPAVSAYFARIRARQEDEKRGLNEKLKKANVLDDSLFVSAQMALHSEEALKEDLSVLENAAAPSEPEMAARLDDLIVRARHYVLCYRFLAAGSSKDDAALAARGRELLRYRLDHADQLKDMYANVMNTRSKGTEGHLWKRIPEVLKEFGGLTPREKPLGMYN